MFDEESEDSFDSIDEVDEPVERGPYAKISDEKYEQFAANWHVVVLPPYSPFLNPVESAHSCLKAVIKRQLSQPQVQLELDNPAPETTLREWRILVLHRIAEEATADITAVKCGGWFRHMLRYLPRCVVGEVIF